MLTRRQSREINRPIYVIKPHIFASDTHTQDRIECFYKNIIICADVVVWSAPNDLHATSESISPPARQRVCVCVYRGFGPLKPAGIFLKNNAKFIAIANNMCTPMSTSKFGSSTLGEWPTENV